MDIYRTSAVCWYSLGVVVVGQVWVLHERLLTVLPEHGLPPLLGAGLEQVLLLDLTPPPQVLEQLVQLPHEDQPPLTAKHFL